ncbi:MAG: hypothetical protein V4617_03375 [Gemmatimonadota bacterium]
MFALVAAALLAVVSLPADSPRRCSMAVERSTRPIDPPVLVIQAASRDSVFDAYYATATMRRVTPDSAQLDRPKHMRTTRAVYGQVFDLRAIDGPDAKAVGAAKRVVVIWWGITPACRHDVPFRAVRDFTGEAFVLARARPVGEWIDGMPTFDFKYNSWEYIPSAYKISTPADSVLTMAEYRTFFPLLPTSEYPATIPRTIRDSAEVRRFWKPLLDWADANPRLAVREPAFWPVCAVRLMSPGDRRCTPRPK